MSTGRLLFFFFMLAVALTGVGVAEAQAKKSFWAILFPFHVKEDPGEQDGGRVVEYTKQAPFVDPGEATSEVEGPLGDLFDPTGAKADGSRLAKPHWHHGQIADWLIKSVSDTLTVDPATYNDHLKAISTHLDGNALNEFHNFMTNSKTLENLRSRNMVLRAFADPPVLLNQAPLNGRYRWLYEVPATLTFLPRGLTNYAEHNPVSYKVVARIQVGRIEPPEEGAVDIIMETFEVRKNTEGP